MNCFTIMPFSDTIHLKDSQEIKIDSKLWTFIFNDWIKKAVESYTHEKITCKRSTATPGNFVKGIIKDIYSSDIVIADLTGQKPNVYYELGIRHSLKLGTIIITQDLKALPSDLASYYCFGYEYSNDAHLNKEYYEKFEKEIHEKIEHIIANKSQADNPVADFLDLKHYYQELKKQEQINLFNELIENLLDEVIAILDIFKRTISSKATYISKNQICFSFFDLMIFDLTVQRFATSNFSEIEKNLLSKTFEEIKALRGALLKAFQFWEGARNNINKDNTKTFITILEEVIKLENEVINAINNLKQIE